MTSARLLRRIVLVAVAATAVATTTIGAGAADAAPAKPAASDLGPNVVVFDPSMPQADIQAKVDAVAEQQTSDQFGTNRYALLFKPGTYGSAEHPLNFEVGYYTEVAGLGRDPGDVTINGSVNVYNQCFADGCTALVNFWRSLSNLRITVTGPGADGNGCHDNTEFWAVSQAAPMRRVQVDGHTTFMDYCTAPSYASGGFVADTSFGTDTPTNGSQQQFLVRNSSLGGYSNGIWNQVFAGVEGAPAQSFPTPPFTTLETTPASKERPYLYLDDAGAYQVFVPAAQRDSRGTTWADGATAGRSVPLSRFYVARPGDSVATINAALARGKDLLFTPGVYDVNRTIKVTRAGTVVLGLGIATLTAVGGAVPMSVADVSGVDIAGLMFDAGPTSSPALLRVGTRDGGNAGRRSDPTALQDVFFRVGGPHLGKTDVALVVNTDHTVLDDIWAWRADHGEGVGWTLNTSDTGVLVRGDDVVATGMFDEHFQKYDLIWQGERGRTIMFQNEMPYDPPSQEAWRPIGPVLGYAAYKVADSVRTHEAWGLGSYIYMTADPSIHASHGFEVPDRPGVVLHDSLTVSITEHGTIDHIVNDAGEPTPPGTTPSFLVRYPVG